MQFAVLFEALDGGDRFGYGCAHRNLAGAAGRSADQNGARSAHALAATVFCARQTKFISKDVQKRSVWGIVDGVTLPVDFEFNRFYLAHTSFPLRRIHPRGNYCL